MSATLAGRTIFITGASRGIGRAIAERVAADGANVVIAAKSDRRHPRLPGTIHETASAVEAAGGQALPVRVDIRDESSIEAAVSAAVERFGGIDALVNNASAISLTGTLETPVRRFDLMMAVNTRGTWLCSRTCLPHLLQAPNPHILNIAPPPDLDPGWFRHHTAYTIAKYGMSLCVLGMAAEFAGRGVAVNALWPRTVIATAALNMLGGRVRPEQCRRPGIMADAAREVLLGDSRGRTGGFLIDEDVLREAGVSDFESYAVSPGQPLAPDLFLGEP